MDTCLERIFNADATLKIRQRSLGARNETKNRSRTSPHQLSSRPIIPFKPYGSQNAVIALA